MLEYIILGFLNEKELTGYEIKQMMECSTSNFIDASFGSIYPALERMLAKGYIVFEEAVNDGKFKKRYAVTQEGKKEFIKWLEEPSVFSPLNYEYLAKLFFFRYLPKDKILMLLEGFIPTIEAQITKLEKIHKDAGNQIDFYGLATLRFGKELYGSILRWYGTLRNEIASM